MADRTPRCPRRTRTAPRHLPEYLMPALLLVAFLAWPAVRNLDAQPGPGPKEAPPGAPTAPANGPQAPGAPAPSTPPPDTAAPPPAPAVQPSPPPAGPPRFAFTIDPKTPLKELLPAAPKVRPPAGPLTGDDLTRVPEVTFQARPAKEVVNTEAARSITHQIAKINHLNGRKADGFLEALVADRSDLAGMPFAMGDACRTKGERSRQFALAVATVRRALQQSAGVVGSTSSAPVVPAAVGGPRLSSNVVTASFVVNAVQQPQAVPVPTGPLSQPPSSEGFWDSYPALCAQEDRAIPQLDHAHREAVAVARVAALMQVLAPESPAMHLGLARYLSGVAHVEATKALARLAIFSPAEEVRRAAVDALKVRRERDYTDVLTAGLRYPWPAVARRAADAIVKLERSDLLPRLVELLEQPDPRAPVTRQTGTKKVPLVREVVRVNHHRNCLLCHAPGNTGKVSADAVTAAVPVPGEPLPSPSDGYRVSSPDLLVRVDVTYLRQDFSAYQPVADANPWPEMQRFDFLVRNRELTEEEAAAYRTKLAPRERGEFSPYQRAALAALRDLTGRDTEPTPEAWRRLLKLSPEPGRTTETP